MNPKASSLHGLAHIIMLIMIVGLVSLYLQLRIRFMDLSNTCENLQRYARKFSDFEKNHCADVSDNGNSHNCFQNEDSSTATPPVLLKVLPWSSSSIAPLNRGERYEQTDLAPDKLVSISVSESSFHSKHTPFETSGASTIDEFGKTLENYSDEVDASTVSSTDVDLLSQISHVEITNAKLLEVLKSQDSEKSQTPVAEVDFFPFKPSSTLEKEAKRKLDDVYKLYNQQHSLEGEVTTESVLISSSVTIPSSSVTGFSDISLSISETSKEVADLVTKISQVEMQSFGPTYLNIHGYDNAFHESAISSTESACADYMLDCGFGCQAVGSDGCDGTEESGLQTEPISPEVVSAGRSLNEGSVFTMDSGHQDIHNILKQAGASDVQALLLKGTSAQCGFPQNDGSHTCHFENLCYKVKEHDFIFFKGEQSVINRQVSLNKADKTDLFDVSLSTLPDHNAFKFSPVFLPSQGLNRFPSVAILQGKSFILHRFKPDNIMHVLHDDILPLYHTLQTLDLIHGYSKPKITLLLTDHFSIGEYASLYKSFSTITPVSLRDLNHVADIICFQDTHIGMSNSTLWYQYGFFKQQGPLNVNVSNLLNNIRSAVKYLNEHFIYECMFCTSKNYMVLLSRKDNRLILNEGELMMSLARSTKLKVISVSMETHPLEEIISLIRSSRGIIGMHGSLLSFVIFLHPGTFVIELFPYAVNPSKYTPFKTFCDLADSGIIYKSWANQNRDKSVPHPDWPAEMGGIHHLSHDEQQIIIDQSEVPDHLCCEDPSWLYHIYQDSEADVAAITSITSKAFVETSSLQDLTISSKSAAGLVKDIPLLPGPVKNLSCKFAGEVTDNKSYGIKYLLIWEIPWNLEFLEYRNLEFQLVISEVGNDSSVSVNLPFNVTFYSLEPADQRQYTVYNVWIRVTVDTNFNGPYVFVTCKNNI